MALQYSKAAAAAVGSTGNNTHASKSLSASSEHVALNVRITAVGGSPTITWKWQGTYDDPSVVDGSADWYDIAARDIGATAATTLVVSQTKTAVGNYGVVLPADCGFTRVRLVTSANTNVTYAADIVEQQT